jgi:glycerophosphoryl diester phosphodiesterase
LQTLYLKNGVGHPSKHKIPTLKQALLVAKGNILINLDKAYNYFDETYKVLQETGTTNQVVIKGFNKTVEDVKADFGNKIDSIIFMPVINLDKQPNASQIIKDFQKELKPKAFEIVFSQDTSKVLNQFLQIKNNGSRIWVNSLWDSLNANHDDDEAAKNPDNIYGWYIDKGINIIQTDRIQLLLEYLRRKNLHD